MIKLGDQVEYDEELWIIEHDYGCDVYRIGNDRAFVDMVNREDLILIVPEENINYAEQAKNLQ